MNTALKIWFTVGAALMLLGGLVFVAALAIGGWNIKSLGDVSYTTSTYEFTDDIKSIYIECDTSNVTLAASSEQKTLVECFESRKENYSVTVKDGKLNIVQNHTAWYGKITFFSFNFPKITVYLPEAVYDALTITGVTSDITVPNDFSFNNIDIDLTTGDVKCNASATSDIKIRSTTGEIALDGNSARSLDLKTSSGDISVSNLLCSEDIIVKIASGDTRLSNVKCKSLISTGTTGDILLKNTAATEKLSITRTTGDATFSKCDAGEIFVKISTGSVTGTLLSDKIFTASSTTGDVSVPKCTSGGICDITTTTGDISLSIVSE